MKIEVGHRDRGVQYNLVSPNCPGKDSKFTPGNPSPTRLSTPLSQSQALTTSKSRTVETCKPKKKKRKKKEEKKEKKRQKKKKKLKQKKRKEKWETKVNPRNKGKQHDPAPFTYLREE